MEQQSKESTNNQMQEPQKAINVRFYHPKLIDKSINLSMLDSLMDLRSVFSEISFLYLYQNYHFEQKGKRLSQTDPVLEVVLPDIQVDIVLHAYTQRTAKFHFSKVAQILNNPDIYVNIYNNSCYQENQTQKDKKQSQAQLNCKFTKTLSFDDIDYSFGNEFLDSEQKQANIELLSFLCFSGFNPPSSSQRLNGDLFYIHLRTLQCLDYHVTASPRGFYINQSKISCFNPHISTTNKTFFINILDLLRTVSDKFKRSLQQYVEERKLSDSDTLRISLASKGLGGNKWLNTCEYQHTWNSRKFLKSDYFRMETIGIKDWNEMFQMNHDLPQHQSASMAQIQKHKNFITIYSEFQAAAIEGSRNLIDGRIPPLNPMDDTKKHIYIYNNIFFSIANQTPFDHSQQKGEQATPSSSAINVDITNLQILQSLRIPDLRVLHMVVVSYRGYKVIAQCIIPGILTGDQSNCSQYGSIDDGKTIETNPEFEKLMVQVCQKLNLKTFVKVKDGQGEYKKIAGSPDIKGILGSDKRKYILDLLRLSPRDFNYQGTQNQVCVLRPQLVRNFINKKKQQKNSQKEGQSNQSTIQINTNLGTQIQFVHQEQTHKQQNLLKEMAQFLTQSQIPQLIGAFKTNMGSFLSDSQGISTAFHKFGINLRYLGKVVNHVLLKDNIDIRICLQRVIVTKCLKHLFKIAMRDSNIMYLNQTITNLLNAIFGRKHHISHLEQGNVVPEQNQLIDSNDAKRKKKKKNKQNDKNEKQQQQIDRTAQTMPPIRIQVSEYTIMKPFELWQIVRKLAIKRFSFELPQNIQEYYLFKIPYQKLATLRDLCISIGLILEKKQYNIVEESKSENDKILPFTIKNIAGLNANAKTRNLKPAFIDNQIKLADSHFDKYSMSDALLNYNQANTSLSILGGSTTEDLAYIRSKIGKIFYVMGSHQQAISSELSALSIYEAMGNSDSAKTIQSYSTLGLYYSVKGDRKEASYYLYKSIFLMLISFGQTYPDFLVNVVNLARMHHQNLQHAKVAQVYLKAISILKAINGKQHFKVSYFYSSLATLYYETADFKKAIEYQTESVSILIKMLPENDNRLIDATRILKRYQQVNVNAAKNLVQMAPRPTFELSQPKKQEKPALNKSKKAKK